MYTIGELFAGIGGFSLAFHATGQAQTAWFVEREPFCQEVLAKNFPGVSIHGDIYDCHDLPYVDIITAGFPCQPFSVAGKREGVNDERYLVPEMFRVIREVQPRVVLFENVPGFASIADGDTFKQFLRTLAEMGFDAEWGHLAAADVGAPHKRERWFCVAYRPDDGYNWQPNRKKPSVLEFNREINANKKDVEKGNKRRNGTTGGSGQNLVNPAGANGETRRADGVGTGEPDAGLACPVGHAAIIHLEGQRAEGQRQPTTSGTTQRTGRTGGNRTIRPTQPRVGRGAHGLSARMDGHRWPARPGQLQHEWEPPRVTDRKDDRANRLRALGNAVVPQVVYPIAQSICEWLAAQDVAAEKVS